MRDFQAEDDEVEDEQPAILLFGGSEGDNSTFRDFDTAVPMLEAPSPSASESDRQSESSSSDPTPYDPSLRTDVLTNEALLSMALSWQDFVQYAGESYTEVHPYFQRVMEEMRKRGMVDENWTWVVDFERVDMGWSRVVVDISRA